ncbi:MAG: hypothetical protein DMG39_00455 [Acidobacteria bacterium]|nr:MAG: hypothetical protein DMG39_00455 [Acidobacteriota bacterium]
MMSYIESTTTKTGLCQ